MNEWWMKRDDEDDFQWKLRLITAKYNKEIDLDWQELVQILNLNCHPDTLRKSAVGLIECHNYYQEKMKNNISDSDVLNQLELKRMELLEERKKLETIRLEYNRIAREKARRELLFEQIKDGFLKLDVPEPIVNINYIDYEKARVLAFGDIHFGKKFKSIHNEYSEEIAINRMNQILSETVAYCEKEKIDHIHVINGADSVEGMTLRTSQLTSLQSGFVDQVIKFSKFYAKWIRELSKYVKVTLHHVTSSNHTELRPHDSNRGEYPAEDLERIIGMYIQDVLEQNDRINVNIYENGFVDFELLGFNICALHGHQVKNNKSILKDLSHFHRKFYDYCYLAHFHYGNDLTAGESGNHNLKIIQIPSVMGSDKYSDSLLTGSKAGAIINTFTKGKGKTDTHEIILN